VAAAGFVGEDWAGLDGKKAREEACGAHSCQGRGCRRCRQQNRGRAGTKRPTNLTEQREKEGKFIKTETLLIKKKRIAQLIYGKPGENQYKHTNTQRTHKERKHHTRTCRLPNSPDTTQLLPLTLEQSNEALTRTPNAYHRSHITI
jgi:hypothetical protein